MQTRNPLFIATLAAGALVAAQAPARPLSQLAKAPAAAPSASVHLEVFLPLRDRAALDTLIKAQHTQGSPEYHHWLTPDQFAARFGPTRASVDRVKASLAANGFRVTQTHSRSFHVVGDVQHAQALLHTTLVSVHSRSGATQLAPALRPTLPATLRAEGATIVQFAPVPMRRPLAMRTAAKLLPENRYSAEGPYWFDDLKQAYDYPSYSPHGSHATPDGTGVNVAILMSDLLFPNDVAAAFTHEKFTAITGKPAPSVNTVLIDGGGVENGYGSFEASLDVQQVLGGAPGANVTLVSIPDLSDQSIVDGYTYIVESNKYDIVNSSFGGCELEYTAAYNGGVDYTYILQAYDEIFAQGNAQGITFVASSGDQGGPMCPTADYGNPGASPTFVAGVSSPADDPHVTAVGGGNLQTTADGTYNSTYVSEDGYGDPDVPYDIYGLGQNVSGGYWGAGGGVSSVFAKPLYQYLAQTGSSKFRTLPDIGMQVGGCPQGLAASCNATDSAAVVAYGVGIGGGYYGVIGTSVSSPEFVGALALYEQGAHRQGNVNYLLYLAGAIQTLTTHHDNNGSHQYFHRGQPGFDGLYSGNYPSTNYNYIFGNGSPDVRKLFGFANAAPAGLPQTSSNP